MYETAEITFSEESLEFAKGNVPDANFILMDILDMNFENSYFDGVIEAGVLFHFTEDEQNNILNKIYSILKPKGKFLSYYPEGTSEGMQQIEVSDNVFSRYERYLKKTEWIKCHESWFS